jgi:hypothetical protein
MSELRHHAALVATVAVLASAAAPTRAGAQEEYKPPPEATAWATAKAEEPPAEPAAAEPAAAEPAAAGPAEQATGQPEDDGWDDDDSPPEEPGFLNRLIFTTGSFIVGGLGGGELGYDRVVSKWVTLDIDVSFLFWGFGEFKIFGLAGRLGFSTFFAGTAPEGWNMIIAASAGSIFIDGDASFLFDAQLLVGHKWAWENNVTFGVGVGVSYLYFHVDKDLTIGGAAPSVGFEFGYAW